VAIQATVRVRRQRHHGGTGLGEQADELPCEYDCAKEPSERACAPDQLVEGPDDERAPADVRKCCAAIRSQHSGPSDHDRNQPHRHSRVRPLGEGHPSILVAHPPPKREDGGRRRQLVITGKLGHGGDSKCRSATPQDARRCWPSLSWLRDPAGFESRNLGSVRETKDKVLVLAPQPKEPLS
jgi:hypothetical protein